MAALVAFDKMPLLVHEALVSEVTALHINCTLCFGASPSCLALSYETVSQ
jgi:hypothetical protein